MKRLKVCYRSDKGRKRGGNEDSLLVKEFGEHYILAVADGLGGHSAGEVASRVAVIEIEEFLKANLTQQIPLEAMKKAMMKKTIEKANREIYLLAKENPSYSGMCSTLVLAIVSRGSVWLANVGDSKAYLVGSSIRQITRDHSLVQELLDRKAINIEEAYNHPQRNIVTRVLGVGDEIEADYYFKPLGAEVLLLCSDGLTDALRDEEIREIVWTASDLEIACSKLIDVANERGGNDNITVILAKEVTDGTDSEV